MAVSYVELFATVPNHDEVGVWCPSCALPSAVTITVLWADTRTLRVVLRQTFTVCVECRVKVPDGVG